MSILGPIKKSKPYSINGNSVSFSNANNKFIGMSVKNSNGKFQPEDNKSSNFNVFKASDESLDAFRKSVYGSNKDAYPESIVSASDEEMSQFFASEKKKFDNAQFIDVGNESIIAVKQNASPGNKSGKTESMSYPTDLNVKQDHFKITKYEYVRPDINQSKSQRYTNTFTEGTGGNSYYTPTVKRTTNVAGDGVINSSNPLGSIFLPMPKATDVNGVEWGKSELTISGLAALGAANMATFGGRFLGGTPEEKKTEADAKDIIENRRRELDGTAFTEGASAIYTQTVSKAAGAAFGVELDADTVLARQGGRVLNPNAEMLFQGPVIRDFAFSFIMIARSQKEGAEIRKIIRFLKLGMAPKFRTTTYLKAPDVFTLEYKNGKGKDDYLKTVNQFNPGGLALTTMNVDYAPNGYWSAYRDSQPVALKMDLNFTELRPIYQGDQAGTPEDSVGY